MLPIKTVTTTWLIAMLGFGVVGCNRTLESVTPGQNPQALPSSQTQPVQSSQLPPVNSDVSQQQASLNQPQQQQPNIQQGDAPTIPQNQQVKTTEAQEEPEQKDRKPISREALAGSWQVPTDGSECRIILAFTKWSGGYRAASRRCVSTEIQSINAWDVKDQSVVLVDQAGNQIARLFASNSGRYDGRTSGGQPISFARN